MVGAEEGWASAPSLLCDLSSSLRGWKVAGSWSAILGFAFQPATIWDWAQASVGFATDMSQPAIVATRSFPSSTTFTSLNIDFSPVKMP